MPLLLGVDSVGNVRPVLVDTSGRVILGAPSAAIPVDIDVAADNLAKETGGNLASILAAMIARTSGNLGKIVPGYTTLKPQFYSASLGNHGLTARWTYTVAASSIAIVDMGVITVTQLTTNFAAYAYLQWTQNAVGASPILLTYGVNTNDTTEIVTPSLIMSASDTLVAVTANNDGANRTFTLIAQIREITL